MDKWEYKIVPVYLDNKLTEETLNAAGKEGWKLKSAASDYGFILERFLTDVN